MKKIYEDDNVVFYSKASQDITEEIVTTSDGNKVSLIKPTLYQMGFYPGDNRLVFINPLTGEDVSTNADQDILPISKRSSKVVYNDQIWSLRGLAVHLQGIFPKTKCPDAKTYDFFRDTNSKKTLTTLEREIWEKALGKQIPENRFEQISKKYVEKERKSTREAIEYLLGKEETLKEKTLKEETLDDRDSWMHVRECEWRLENTDCCAKAKTWKELFKQVVQSLNKLQPEVLDKEMIACVLKHNVIFKTATKEVFSVTGNAVSVNDKIGDLEITNLPNNHRNIETYAESMWVEIVPNWFYIWALYDNDALAGKLKTVFKLFGKDYHDLKIKAV